MKDLWMKYKSIVMYLIFGVITTAVNIVSYAFFAKLCGMNTIISNILAWVLAVTFAYITNKIWVFESKCKEVNEIIGEILKFFGCRLSTGVLDVLIMYVFVDLLFFNDMIIKCASNVIVILLNYVASRLFIFKSRQS